MKSEDHEKLILEKITKTYQKAPKKIRKTYKSRGKEHCYILETC